MENKELSMRIAITGSQGVGKTTTCLSLKEHLKKNNANTSIEIIGNISRFLLKKYYVNTDDKSAINDYYMYVAEYYKRLYYSKSDITIHDRTLLDSMAYQVCNNNASEAYYVMLEELVRFYIKGIDFYFYIPVEFDIVDDGIRNIDNDYQKKIDMSMKSLLTKFNVDYQVLSGSVQDRINTIMNSIQ